MRDEERRASSGKKDKHRAAAKANRRINLVRSTFRPVKFGIEHFSSPLVLLTLDAICGKMIANIDL